MYTGLNKDLKYNFNSGRIFYYLLFGNVFFKYFLLWYISIIVSDVSAVLCTLLLEYFRKNKNDFYSHKKYNTNVPYSIDSLGKLYKQKYRQPEQGSNSSTSISNRIFVMRNNS